MKKRKIFFLGMPMSWESSTKKALHTMWNADDDRLSPPQKKNKFGIGWTVNLHTVIRKFGLVPKDGKKRSSVSDEKKDRS
jgi:hypothetical protein